MDNDLKLADVINDPVALNQFLEYSVNTSIHESSLKEIPHSTDEDFLNFENGQVDYPSGADLFQWNYPSPGSSNECFDAAMVSATAQTTNAPVETSGQVLPVGCASLEQCSLPGFLQVQQSGNELNQLSGVVISDDSLRVAPPVNKIATNFSTGNSLGANPVVLNYSSGTGNQVLMNLQPQTVVQNGAIHIQYVQVQNQLQSLVQTGTQVPTSGMQTGLGLQVAHGIQKGINLQGTLMPTHGTNQILLQPGHQPLPATRIGQVNLQPIQICSSNLVGGTQDSGLSQGTVVQQGTSFQQGTGLQQAQVPGLLGRTSVMGLSGQVVESNMNLSGGRHVVLQRTQGGVGTQNVVYQTRPQQHSVTLPVQTVDSHDSKLPEGHQVVQIGGQMYRFEHNQQSTSGVGLPVKQGAVFQQSQGVGFSDGSGVTQDPVKMLQQNVQLQQMLIGNQINVLQMLQQQQQQQHLQPKAIVGGQDSSQPGKNIVMVGQHTTGNSVMMIVAPHQSSGGLMVNPTETTNGSTSSVSTIPLRPTFTAQSLRPQHALEKSGVDPSSQGSAKLLPASRSGPITTLASHLGLQFIQPKPSVSVTSGPAAAVMQPLNVFPSSTNTPLQLNSKLPASGSPAASAQLRPQITPSLSDSHSSLKSGNLQGPQTVVGGQPLAAGQSQTVTTVQLSAEQQNLLVKIQSQMKTLLDLPKRNPDQEKYLQMLVSGQQRIISQGVAQYLQQQQKTAGVASVASGAQQTVTVAQPAGVGVPASGATDTSSCAASGGATSVASALSVVTSSGPMSVPLPSPSSLQHSAASGKTEDLFQAFPYLKEKLEAQLAKMPPEQRQWFAKNQSIVFAKLQHHHRLLMEREKQQQQQQQHQSREPHQDQPQLKLPAAIQQNSAEVSAPADVATTRVIRSLHLTRAQKFHLYLQKDQKRATHPEYSKPFENFKDVIRSLVPYHVFQTREPSVEDMTAVEGAFEEKSRDLLERKNGMLRKYQALLLDESTRPQLTSEVVLLERAFHSDEKALLLEEKRQAEEDPDSFVPRPVIKRLKLDDDVKKEEDFVPDEDTGSIEAKMEAPSPAENTIKEECPSPPSSPTDSSARRHHIPSSVERYKSLQIKLEKLENTDEISLHCRSALGNQNSTADPTRNGDLQNSEPLDVVPNCSNQSGSSSWFDGSTEPVEFSADSFQNFTEDDEAVASLLNTEHLSVPKRRDLDPHPEIETTTSCAATSLKHSQSFSVSDDVDALGESTNPGFSELTFNDKNTNFLSTEQDGDDDDMLMRGTINSLMADLTQFNNDLGSTSWAGSESRRGTLNGTVRWTGSQSMCVSAQQSGRGLIRTDSANTSLQQEMQCAIDSIIQLQQPWSEDGSNLSVGALSSQRTDDEDTSLDEAVNSIL